MDTRVLDAHQQHIVCIAAFTARGDMPRVNTALHEGLNAGLTVNEIKEVLIQVYAYAGFPRSLNGIHAFMTVMEERKTRGITDKEGEAAHLLGNEVDKDAYGARVRAHLSGQENIPAPTGYQLFTPAIDAFLKQHLFADIFSRQNLDFQSRELATVAILSSLSGLGGQLRFHLGAALNVGLTEAQLRHFTAVIAEKVGNAEGQAASNILENILKDRTR